MARLGVGACVYAGTLVLMYVLLWPINRSGDEDDVVVWQHHTPLLTARTLPRSFADVDDDTDNTMPSPSLLTRVVAYAFVERSAAFVAVAVAVLLVSGSRVEAAVGAVAFVLLLAAVVVATAAVLLFCSWALRLLCVTDAFFFATYSGPWPLLECIAVAQCHLRGGAHTPLFTWPLSSTAAAAVAASAHDNDDDGGGSHATTTAAAASRARRSRLLRSVAACLRTGHVPLAWVYVSAVRVVWAVLCGSLGGDASAISVYNTRGVAQPVRVYALACVSEAVAGLAGSACVCVAMCLPSAVSLCVSWGCVRAYVAHAPHSTLAVAAATATSSGGGGGRRRGSEAAAAAAVPLTSLLYPAAVRRAALSLSSSFAAALSRCMRHRHDGGKKSSNRGGQRSGATAAAAPPALLLVAAHTADDGGGDGAATTASPPLLPGSTAADAERRRRIALAALAQRMQQQQRRDEDTNGAQQGRAATRPQPTGDSEDADDARALASLV